MHGYLIFLIFDKFKARMRYASSLIFMSLGLMIYL